MTLWLHGFLVGVISVGLLDFPADWIKRKLKKLRDLRALAGGVR